jgi:predicted protein tyrosine phosphatase
VITLSDAQWLTTAIASTDSEYLVSLMSPNSMVATPSTIAPENHLKLGVDDVEELAEGYIAPCRAHIEALLEFGCHLDESAEIVVHCVMGMSRSPAAVMILMAQKAPGRENEIADIIFEAVPEAHPNRLLLQLGDEALGCDGDLVRAVYNGEQFAPSTEPKYIGSLDGFHSFPLIL